MAPYGDTGLGNIGSGNGLMPGGTIHLRAIWQAVRMNLIHIKCSDIAV